MKTLHILRSEPSDFVKMLVEQISGYEESVEVPLYEGDIDYDCLLNYIFDSDRVISWW
jgi:hypothetical protein